MTEPTDVQTEKLHLIRWITQLTDESVIARIKVLREGKTDWWDEISPEEKAEIEEGLAQADRGELSDHEEVRAKHDKLL